MLTVAITAPRANSSSIGSQIIKRAMEHIFLLLGIFENSPIKDVIFPNIKKGKPKRKENKSPSGS